MHSLHENQARGVTRKSRDRFTGKAGENAIVMTVKKNGIRDSENKNLEQDLRDHHQDWRKHDPIDAVYTWINGSDSLLIQSLMRVRLKYRKQEDSFTRVLDSWSQDQRCSSLKRRTGVTRSYESFLEMLPAFVVPNPMTSDANSTSSFSWIPFSGNLSSFVSHSKVPTKRGAQEGIPSSDDGNRDSEGDHLLRGYTSASLFPEERTSKEDVDETPSSPASSLFYFSSHHGIDKSKDEEPHAFTVSSFTSQGSQDSYHVELREVRQSSQNRLWVL